MKTSNFANSLGLTISAATVNEINPIILSTSINMGSFGNVVMNDKVPTLIDVANNTAEPITSATIASAATAGLTSKKPTGFQATAISASEKCNSVQSVTFVKNPEGSISSPQSILAFAKDGGFKIDDIEVNVQNDIIFKTTGINSISGLTKFEDKYFQLDVANNDAKVIDAAAMTKEALAAFKAGKANDMTRFVEAFGLVTKLVLVKKGSDVAVDADSAE